jgi:hypothetical protein
MLLRQAQTGSTCIRCPLCADELHAEDKTIVEHMHPIALGGADEEANTFLVHKECAHLKTYGNGGTTAGSDAHAIAKSKRLQGITGTRKKEIAALRRKIPSRPFEKRFKRLLDGRVVKTEEKKT